MKDRNRNRRGMSLIEVMIAIAIVCMVSFASVLVITTTAGVSNKASDRMVAVNAISNLLECCKATNDFAGYTNAVGHFFGANYYVVNGTTLTMYFDADGTAINCAEGTPAEFRFRVVTGLVSNTFTGMAYYGSDDTRPVMSGVVEFQK